MRTGFKANLKVQKKDNNQGRQWKRKNKFDYKDQKKRKMECNDKAQWRLKRLKPNPILNELAESSNKKQDAAACAIESEKESVMKHQENCSNSFNETSEKTNTSLETQVKCKSRKKRKRKRGGKGLGENESLHLNEVPEKKTFNKKNSHEKEGETAVSAANSENIPSTKDQENYDNSFNELQDNKPIEIISEGLHILSETENGQSKMLYKPDFYPNDEAFSLCNKLSKTTDWNRKDNIIRGVKFPQPRLVAWYGPFPYSYSGSTFEAAEMPDCILKIKQKIEAFLREKYINVSFNAVLLNCYRNGKDSVAWHCDDELTMGVCPTIASVSLGATRKFELRKKFRYLDKDQPSKFFLNLTNGSLLIMDGCMQEVWQHRIPKQYSCQFVRVNLTFRTVYPLDKISSLNCSRENVKHGNSNREVPNFYNNDDNKDHLMTSGLLCNIDSSADNSHNIIIKKENTLNQELSVSSEEFALHSSVPPVIVNFDCYSLQELIEYPFMALDSVNLKKYEHSLKKAIEVGVMQNLRKKDYDEFRFLSSLTEATTNTDRIRKLICKRMCWVIKNHYESVKLVNFYSYSLQELVEYPFKTLDGVNLKNYSYSLKKAIKAEVMENFRKKDHDEFRFLSLITDGTHTDRNQKLIAKRMCWLIEKHYKKVKTFQKEQTK